MNVAIPHTQFCSSDLWGLFAASLVLILAGISVTKQYFCSDSPGALLAWVFPSFLSIILAILIVFKD